MEYTKVLKQAWNNVISYRALWIFGLILALTTASSANAFWGDNDQEGVNREGILGTGVTLDMQPGDNFLEAFGDAMVEVGEEVQKEINQVDADLTRFYRDVLGLEIQSDFLKVLTIILWTVVLLFIVGQVLRYVSETALIMMVDAQEETGEQLRTRDGFRLGFSRTSWRLFLIDLMINIPAALVFILMFVLVFSPLLLLALGIAEVGVLSALLTAGLFFLFIFLAIIATQVLSLLKHFVRRECAVRKLSPLASIRSGFRLVWSNLKEVGLMWLVLVGVNIGWPIALGIIAIFLLAVASVIGGVGGLLIGVTAGAFGVSEPILAGFAVGIPLFMLVLIIPLLFLSGLKEVFESSTWTLTYRELGALSSLKAEAVPQPEAA